MSANPNPPTVAIINQNVELRRAIAEIAEGSGFRAIGASPDEAGATTDAVQRFLRQHDARVVVYDVAAPLRESWAALNALRYAEMISGSWRQFVVTTADEAALAGAVGAGGAIGTTRGLDRAALARALERAVLV